MALAFMGFTGLAGDERRTLIVLAVRVAAALALALGCGTRLGCAARLRRRRPLVERIDALLPQTQCGQCGYPGCRPYAAAIARGEADIDRCPPGGEATVARTGRAARPRPRPVDPRYGVTRRAVVAWIDEDALHRLRPVPAGLPRGCDRRRAALHAHGDRDAVHRLRTLPCALPGRLHRAASRRPARWPGRGWLPSHGRAPLSRAGLVARVPQAARAASSRCSRLPAPAARRPGARPGLGREAEPVVDGWRRVGVGTIVARRSGTARSATLHSPDLGRGASPSSARGRHGRRPGVLHRDRRRRRGRGATRHCAPARLVVARPGPTRDRRCARQASPVSAAPRFRPPRKLRRRARTGVRLVLLTAPNASPGSAATTHCCASRRPTSCWARAC